MMSNLEKFVEEIIIVMFLNYKYMYRNIKSNVDYMWLYLCEFFKHYITVSTWIWSLSFIFVIYRSKENVDKEIRCIETLVFVMHRIMGRICRQYTVL